MAVVVGWRGGGRGGRCGEKVAAAAAGVVWGAVLNVVHARMLSVTPSTSGKESEYQYHSFPHFATCMRDFQACVYTLKCGDPWQKDQACIAFHTS